jgi:hypothetical protein
MASEDGLCARFGAVDVGGTVEEPRVVELSGFAASRHHAGVLWGHNDSGGAPELYALSEDGRSLGAYHLDGVEAIDWEDMAAGPDALYVGDIGDNGAERSTVTVHRVPEPDETPMAPGAPLADAEAIELRYPSGPSDAEALLVDPRTGDLVIVTKSLIGASRILSAPASALVPGAPVTLTDAGALQVPLPSLSGAGLPGTAVTGGDVSPDGSIVLLRTYRSVLAFERTDGQSLADALLGEPCFGPQEEEPQGEAIAFTGDGAAYVTASEGSGVPIHRIEIAAPPTTTTTAATAAPSLEGDIVERSPDRRPAIVAAIVVALLLVGLNVWARRRSAG